MYNTHKHNNNNNKMITTILSILVCVVACFMIGYYIGVTTLTPTEIDTEPTAQELIQDIHSRQ